MHCVAVLLFNIQTKELIVASVLQCESNCGVKDKLLISWKLV